MYEATNQADASETKEEEAMSSIHEDSKEEEAEEDSNLPTFPYERLKTDSEDPVPDIDLTRREVRFFKTFLTHYNIHLIGFVFHEISLVFAGIHDFIRVQGEI